MAKRKKRKKRKKKIKKQIRKGGRKGRSRKRVAALILSILAIVFLIINSLTALLAKGTILENLQAIPELIETSELLGLVSGIISFLAVLWLVLAVLIAYMTYLLEKRKKLWYVLLILGIISLVTGRIFAGIFAIVSSILYKA